MSLFDIVPSFALQGMLLAGLAIYFVSTFIEAIPFLDKLLPIIGKFAEPIKALMLPLIITGAMGIGYDSANKDWKTKYAEIEVANAKLETKNAELAAAGSKVTVETVIKYVDRVKVVKEKGDEIIIKVPEFITKVDDNACTVNNGFRVLHDAAASNTSPPEVSGATRDSYAKPSGIELSTVAKTVTLNYTEYHKVVEQLRGLQDWLRKQQALWNSSTDEVTNSKQP